LRQRGTLPPWHLYDGARGLAEGAFRDHGEHAAADALPATCPYSFDQLTGSWLPK
jgi:hypothetical protein